MNNATENPTKTAQRGILAPAIAMFVLYGLLALVTHLSAPIGAVWKVQPGIDGSNFLGMAGNMMTFGAYLFMGIPAGRLLMRIGYKRTALAALALGVGGTVVQILSGRLGLPVLPSFAIYLFGTFICGFACCMLNIVINPMLNTLGGGGKRGNQLICFGGGVNSIVSTLAPIVVMLLIGEVTAKTSFRDVDVLLWSVLLIFAFAFVVFSFIRLPEPAEMRDEGRGRREEGGGRRDGVGMFEPMKIRHAAVGIVGIFFYIGIEIGVPGILNLWMLDPKGAFEATTPAVAGSVTGMFFFLMLVGRFAGSWIGGKFSSRAILVFCSAASFLCIASGVFLMGTMAPMAVFTGKGFALVTVPLGTCLLATTGLFVSVMWATTYNLTVEGLGRLTEAASGLLMTMVVGGGVLPLVQGFVADRLGYVASYALPAFGALYLAAYGIWFCVPDRKDGSR